MGHYLCRYFDFGVFLWVGKVSALVMYSFGYGNGLFCAKTSVQILCVAPSLRHNSAFFEFRPCNQTVLALEKPIFP
jgi:hypothetical protein